MSKEYNPLDSIARIKNDNEAGEVSANRADIFLDELFEYAIELLQIVADEYHDIEIERDPDINIVRLILHSDKFLGGKHRIDSVTKDPGEVKQLIFQNTKSIKLNNAKFGDQNIESTIFYTKQEYRDSVQIAIHNMMKVLVEHGI